MRIFDYAKVSDWEDRLRHLSEIAVPERWTFRSVPDRSSLPVLDHYVRFTFLQAFDQKRICETDRLSCFNTGLLTPEQQEIYAVFKLHECFDPGREVSAVNRKWYLTVWARAGDRMLTEFTNLPALPTYWNDPSELTFDPGLPVQLNLDHILRENLNRFPEELGGKLNASGCPTDFSIWPDLDENAGEPAVTIPLPTRNALEGAMKASVRLAQHSYRFAVPQFYRGNIQLLLPLYLRDPGRADLAVTLEKHGGWYRAATVLYPDWAYRQARLLARPNSEWLGGFRTDLPAA